MIARRLGILVVLVACGSHGTDVTDKAKPLPPKEVPVAAAPAIPPPPPFEVAPPTDKIVSIGRNELQACVVRESGAVDCWGADTVACEWPEHCRLLIGVHADHHVRRVAGVTDATQISEDAHCILRKTGEVACKGERGFQFETIAGLKATHLPVSGDCFIVGTGDIRCREEAELVTVPNIHDARSIVADMLGACAVRANGDVLCGTKASEPWKRVAGLDHVDALAFPDGERRTSEIACVMKRGALSCFLLDLSEARIVKDYVTEFDGAAELLRGATHLGMSELDGRLILEGLVGGKIVVAEHRGRAAIVPVLADATRHVSGCAIRAQGSVVCWGRNAGGVLGQPSTMGSENPAAPVVGIADVVEVALAGTHTFARTSNGVVHRIGEDGVKPVALDVKDIVQIAASANGELCVRSSGGVITCDGRVRARNADSILRLLGGSLDSYLQVHQRDGSDVSYRWHETEPEVTSPGEKDPYAYAVPWDKDARVIVEGSYDACAISAGVVRCAREKLDRDFQRAGYETPLDVPGIVDATALASFLSEYCAIHGDGRVSCWTTADEDKPFAIGPIATRIESGAKQVFLGDGRTYRGDDGVNYIPGRRGCAIMRDRTVRCWGTNYEGELGDGTVIESRSPIGIAL